MPAQHIDLYPEGCEVTIMPGFQREEFMMTRHLNISVDRSLWSMFLYDDRMKRTTSCCNFDPLSYRHHIPLTLSVYVVVYTNSNWHQPHSNINKPIYWEYCKRAEECLGESDGKSLWRHSPGVYRILSFHWGQDWLKLSVTCENLCNRRDVDFLSFVLFLIRIVRGMQPRTGLLASRQQPSL